MKIVSFYVQDLSEISSKFEEMTGNKFSYYCDEILIRNRAFDDSWYVKCISILENI